MNETALDLDAVESGYGQTTVVRGVSLRVPARGAVAVLGRNGAGKTTLVNTIAGRVRQFAGSVRVFGDEMRAAPASARCRAGIGLVPQDRQIFRTLSVEENLIVADLRRGWRLDMVYDLFPRLAARRQQGGGQLSGGEQQMLAIGRALMGGPRCLLLDEPFEGLAPVVVDGLLAVLHRLRQESGMTMLLVEQHARLALELADSAVVMDRGRVALAGSRDELVERWGELETLLAVSAS